MVRVIILALILTSVFLWPSRAQTIKRGIDLLEMCRADPAQAPPADQMAQLGLRSACLGYIRGAADTVALRADAYCVSHETEVDELRVMVIAWIAGPRGSPDASAPANIIAALRANFPC